LDEILGVDRENLMADVKEILLYTTAYNTPEESSRILDKCSFISLHPTQIKRAITKAHELMESSGTELMDAPCAKRKMPPLRPIGL